MKRIKSRRQMAAGIIALVLALLCFAVLLLAGYQARFLAAGVLALAWSAVSFSPIHALSLVSNSAAYWRLSFNFCLG